jgi:cysteine-rich secretory family protein
VAAILAAIATRAAPALADNGAAPVVDAFRPREDQLALLVDRARSNAGVLPLARAAELDHAAIAHANDMVVTGDMDHDAPDGSTPASRAADAGYRTPPGSAWLVVEVISARGDEPEDALDWWLGDSLHRRVLLRSTWREMGIGFAAGGPYGRFWVMEFGCRPDVLPPVFLDGTLTIPDENCGSSPSAFGSTQSIRIGETTDTLQKVDWEPYSPQRAWPAGKPAVVEARDAQGKDVTTAAADARGATAETP